MQTERIPKEQSNQLFEQKERAGKRLVWVVLISMLIVCGLTFAFLSFQDESQEADNGNLSDWVFSESIQSEKPLTPYANDEEKMVFEGTSTGSNFETYYLYTLYKKSSAGDAAELQTE